MALSTSSGHEDRAQSSISAVGHTKHPPATNPSRPSHHSRTLSSPLLSPLQTSQDATAQHPCHPVTSSTNFPLTPPTTPRQTKSSTNLASIMTQCHDVTLNTHTISLDDHSDSLLGAVGRNEASGSSEPIECPFEVEIVKDAAGREQTFGRGAWSTVYRAIGRERTRPVGSMLPTPPSSPVLFVPLIVAVKKPARKDAKGIIRNEGIVLSHAATTGRSDQFIIPFYGFLSSMESLVLGPVPLSLHGFIENRGKETPRAAWPSPDPVIGSMVAWMNLAEHTINGLAWLHTEAGGGGVVHGDVKPGNILLSPDLHAGSDFPFTPLYADFSSSRLLSASTITPNTLSAVTREYTAPELLSSKILNDPKSVATTASDVFSLAVTLLVAATGELMVYPGSMWQRQAMATQGWEVLNLVRNGGQGQRVPRHGVVDRVLERAVLNAGMGRIDALSWATLVEQMRLGAPTKKG